LLSGYFVVDGLKAAINPEPLVPEAEHLAEKVSQYAQSYLPGDGSPIKTATIVRVHGLVQVTGALMMATGIFRRAGALLVAVSYGEKVFRRRTSLLSPDATALARELTLLGGVLIEAGDTQGKPNWSWLAADRRRTSAHVRRQLADRPARRPSTPPSTARSASPTA